MNQRFLSEKKPKIKNYVIKAVIIISVVVVLLLFLSLFDYSYINNGAEIFESIKNGG